MRYILPANLNGSPDLSSARKSAASETIRRQKIHNDFVVLALFHDFQRVLHLHAGDRLHRHRGRFQGLAIHVPQHPFQDKE
jgi:hypothetical protein